jgi:hypothetical protein
LWIVKRIEWYVLGNKHAKNASKQTMPNANLIKQWIRNKIRTKSISICP